MELVTSKMDGDVLVLETHGRIDSGNAEAVEKRINELREQAPNANVIVDADGLEYISSAGLRVVLRLRKAVPDMKIINVSSDIYEIFDMTGFAEMIPIEKAYRRLSVDGCEVIGQGANGKVYRLDPDTIIKVYFNSDSLPDIQRERELARRAFVLGIPTAIPYDVVRVGDSFGSVFELLNAKSFAALMVSEPENVDHYIDMDVELLKKIHATEVRPEDMPDMREVALGWAKFVCDYLPEEEGKKLVSLVSAVPVDHHMMHGDYHIKNVMLQNGEALLIDMDTLCQGHPIFELASMYNAYQGFSYLDHSVTEKFLGISHELATRIWEKSLALYLGTTDAARIDSVAKKAQLMGFTRLLRRDIRRNALETETGRANVKAYQEGISRLLREVNELTF